MYIQAPVDKALGDRVSQQRLDYIVYENTLHSLWSHCIYLLGLGLFYDLATPESQDKKLGIPLGPFQSPNTDLLLPKK